MPPPFLTFTYFQEDPFPIRETLSIYPDGSAWLWLLAAASPERRDRAGTFRLVLDAGTQARAAQLAAALAAQPAQALATERPGGMYTAVRAQSGAVTRTHPLAAGGDLAGSALLDEARTMGDSLLMQAGDYPLAAVRMAVRPDALSPSTLLFTFESIGSEDVTFLLAPETFAAWADTGEGSQLRWRNEQNTAMGLVGAFGRYLDGVYGPATLPPGEKASVVYQQVVDLAGAASLSGEAEVTLTLAGQGDATPPEAEAHCWLHSRPAPYRAA